ncbi:MAG: NADH-quinone oxidoreductase subunit J [Candidatus Dadabacteria bacterium]|nr:NADH-quinone oxidoreductase subunit J [Candidatus Dadabacteria bacterium]NIQ13668.1 NADH-quinone oxidoreductase subunit J [Candidatus Dadabacteria bacterium]
MSQTIIFYIFAILAVAGSIIVVSHKNPVTSAISLVLTLFSTAVLFVLLNAHFIAAIQVLVYAGAIMVLFLFTVMFLNIRESDLSFDTQNIPKKLTFLFIFVVVIGLFASKLFLHTKLFSKLDNPQSFGTVKEVGKLLFTKYLLPFELTSILIVVAIVGVVVIAKVRSS